MAYHGADQMYPGLSKRDFAPGFIMYPRQEMMKKEYNLLNTKRSKWLKESLYFMNTLLVACVAGPGY